jgi:signal transduction histidine kinase
VKSLRCAWAARESKVNSVAGEHFRKLKHELRTPINHIIGYSELMKETAGDADDSTIVTLSEQVNQLGKSLARELERALMDISVESDDSKMQELRFGVLPIVREIVSVLTQPPARPNMALYGKDMERMKQAADQLMNWALTNKAPES